MSNDLRYDAIRDLTDIGAGYIPVNALNKVSFVRTCGFSLQFTFCVLH